MAWPGGSLSPGLLPSFLWVSVARQPRSLPSTSQSVPWFYCLFVGSCDLCCYLVDLFLDLPS